MYEEDTTAVTDERRYKANFTSLPVVARKRAADQQATVV